MPFADKPTDVSEQVLESVQRGQQAALEAVRTFMDNVNNTLPPGGEWQSKRQELLDGAFQMTDRLIQTQYDFLRTVVRSAGETLGARSPETGKE